MLNFAPALFVFLWSTGFIGAKYGLPYADALSFLLVRYACVITAMLAVAVLTRAPWPQAPRQWFHIAVSGVLVQACYLGGVFLAIEQGLPAGVTALVVGMQPLLTALSAGILLGERVSRWQWSGLALGFAGVLLVVGERFGADGQLPMFGMLTPALVALFAITAGTLYQKKFCPTFDLRTGSVIQFVPSALFTALAVALFGEFRVAWTPDFLFALGWLVLVLSLGAISLLNLLIRGGNAVNVAALFYLTPPTTAVIAWLLFDETLSLQALLGMVLAVGGVWLARKV